MCYKTPIFKVATALTNSSKKLCVKQAPKYVGISLNTDGFFKYHTTKIKIKSCSLCCRYQFCLLTT